MVACGDKLIRTHVFNFEMHYVCEHPLFPDKEMSTFYNQIQQ